jgi:glycosyltransferase involved in cell wall biosynthesis
VLTVGVDAWNIPHDRRGIGRYVRSILREWRERFSDRVRVVLVVPEWHTWTVRARYGRDLGRPAYPVISRALHARAKLDVLWFPFNGCSWLNFTKPAVATLHDATSFAIEGYAPETRVIFRNAVRVCRKLITDSRFSQAELARALEIPASRLTPVPLGVSMPAEIPMPSTLDTARLQPYVLFVGTTERRKGVDVLVRAMERVQRAHPELQLVLAGARGDALAGTERIGMTELGFVDDAALEALYRGAAIFAFPSRYEGFGLPVLEAMSYGVPVVATDVAALPEVSGDAAFSVAPGDESAIAAAIERIYDDPQLAQALRRRGLERAREMSWTKTAEATLAVLEAAGAS